MTHTHQEMIIYRQKVKQIEILFLSDESSLINSLIKFHVRHTAVLIILTMIYITPTALVCLLSEICAFKAIKLIALGTPYVAF